jgi:hypothetical protein
MSIPRISAMLSTRKWQKQSFDENKEFVKTIQAETFGQITNETTNYSSESPKYDVSSGKIIQAETFGQITDETENYNFGRPKEKARYVFGAGNLSDLLKILARRKLSKCNQISGSEKKLQCLSISVMLQNKILNTASHLLLN